LTIGLYIDGLKKMLHGCAGNAVFEFISGKPVNINWTFQGIWNAPTSVAILAPDYPTDSPLRFASSAIIFGAAYTPRLSRATLDLGNQVVMVEDSTTESGYKHAMIVGRKPTFKIDAETELIATYDWYGRFLAGTQTDLSMVLGTTGNQVTFTAPKIQITNINEGDRNKVQVENVEYQLNRNADPGDDELVITIK
jgi:hypothetical protein